MFRRPQPARRGMATSRTLTLTAFFPRQWSVRRPSIATPPGARVGAGDWDTGSPCLRTGSLRPTVAPGPRRRPEKALTLVVIRFWGAWPTERRCRFSVPVLVPVPRPHGADPVTIGSTSTALQPLARSHSVTVGHAWSWRPVPVLLSRGSGVRFPPGAPIFERPSGHHFGS